MTNQRELEMALRRVNPALPIFSGTTLENFLTCAYMNRRGRVLFDKLREPRFISPEIYCTHDFGIASGIALREARYLHYRPLVFESMIMEGDFDITSIRQLICLRVGLILHIQRCFLIGSDIIDLDALEVHQNPPAFQEYSPQVVLNFGVPQEK